MKVGLPFDPLCDVGFVAVWRRSWVEFFSNSLGKGERDSSAIEITTYMFVENKNFNCRK